MVIRLYQAASLVEAQLLVGELNRHGIRTYVRNEALQGALGELPLSLRPEVCIMEAKDLERAQVILQTFSGTKAPASTDLRRCETCKEESPANFELCWKCRRPLDAIASDSMPPDSSPPTPSEPEDTQ